MKTWNVPSLLRGLEHQTGGDAFIPLGAEGSAAETA